MAIKLSHPQPSPSPLNTSILSRPKSIKSAQAKIRNSSHDNIQDEISSYLLLITCVRPETVSTRSSVKINQYEVIRGTRGIQNLSRLLLWSGLTFVTFQFQLFPAPLRPSSVSSNISFVSKLLLLMESVYSNFYVITFQYFHLYLVRLIFSVKRSVLSFEYAGSPDVVFACFAFETIFHHQH